MLKKWYICDLNTTIEKKIVRHVTTHTLLLKLNGFAVKK